ncbi:Flp pilus assembly complex ATPase component TadA [Alicyclobacillus cycloheptanicus]|uniref:Type II secretory pathway predicted ATPase ExeA n=1 Tax=Alicyclobacillus cycloheptanicus TaxID=1457 RepID=A0ABT9XMU9_9BACL|nr:AAA family ATPase [Alicyclobacillus cycloheptanicus]MDQ0191649.1 type II secretory pathway predicted ATPase ExeA [Alicyclobacillus cycloheptanicus]WDM00273.1 Flp pilus assembly complex ATPase component TadA [Alicyclobacillus cycloheptanicus]WDM01510.1 Flp pilus assembly complex ATPase component TadA [Alicyclobacillus cycloheptanicus]WDM01757.1 Flp pilus assembly complex ATPase component TadA [Alicyclobacillus cycloheptanicus]WDM01997.1 Flp pilus assembly complex ATPase component TadA [Alicy
MMTEFFGFAQEPFDRDIPVERLVAFHGHSELSARLIYATEHRHMALVTGDTGTGKTTAVRAVMKRMDESQYKFMYIANAGLTPKTLYRVILERLQIQPRFRQVDNQALVHQVLEESYQKGQQVVIIVDEAHELDPQMLAEFRFLNNFRADSFSPISLWLVGQTELREKMKLRILTSLSGRIQIRYHMGTLTEAEVQDYVSKQLASVGQERTIFSADAVKLIARTSQGNPRLINTLCRGALIDAATLGHSVVDNSHVERAWMEVSGS